MESDETGLYGELPPGIGPLMDLASALIHRAFTAHKAGDLATCDAFIAEGQQACGGIFQMNAEYVVRWPNHTDDPAWMAFLARLGTMIEPFAPEIPAPQRADRDPGRVKVTGSTVPPSPTACS